MILYGENVGIGKGGVRFADKDGRVLSMGEAGGKILARVASWGEDFWLMVINCVSEHCAIYTVRRWVFRWAGLNIASSSKVHMGVRFFRPGGIAIGEDSVVGFRSFLDGRAPLKIGDHVSIASEVMVYNSEHDIEDLHFKAREEAVEIGDYVFIGPRAIILPGVKIGKGAVVAAGAVVTRDVPEMTVVGGVPAKEISLRKIGKLQYRIGRTRLFC